SDVCSSDLHKKYPCHALRAESNGYSHALRATFNGAAAAPPEKGGGYYPAPCAYAQLSTGSKRPRPLKLRSCDHLGDNSRAHGFGRTDYAITLATTPAPTVLVARIMRSPWRQP